MKGGGRYLIHLEGNLDKRARLALKTMRRIKPLGCKFSALRFYDWSIVNPNKLFSDHTGNWQSVYQKLSAINDSDFSTPVVHKDYITFYKLSSTDVHAKPIAPGEQKEVYKVTAEHVTLSDLALWTGVNMTKDQTVFELTWRDNGEKYTTRLTVDNEHLFKASKDEQAFIVERLIIDACKTRGYPSQINGWMIDNLKVKQYAQGGIVKGEWNVIKNASLYSAGFESIPPNPNSPSELSKKLPGIDTVVSLPCNDKCNWYVKYDGKASIRTAVIHLNDYHKWSREKIADWLDLLQERDGIDLTFKVEDDTVESTTTENEEAEAAYAAALKEWQNVGHTTDPIINKPADILKGINPA